MSCNFHGETDLLHHERLEYPCKPITKDDGYLKTELDHRETKIQGQQ